MQTAQNVAPSIPYRPYIDGLRGVAVIVVALYHAQLFGVTGGYIGVDVFFVISGFLIASVVKRDLSNNTFSLIAFWERRIRRIIPALFVVVLCTFGIAYTLTMYPRDYLLLGQAVIAQSVFVSNIYFMQSDGYFDRYSLYSPLIHTWSLSVEEQFYVLFPLIVLLCFWFVKRVSKRSESSRLSRIVLVCIATLGIASFFSNVWFTNIVPDSVFSISVSEFRIGHLIFARPEFYLITSRFWELALGVLLALSFVRVRSALLAETLAVTGIVAVIASIFLYDNTTSFPGYAALLPTLGAVAVITANESHPTIVGSLLSYSRLVWVGLISYSFYLWHKPILVFAQIVRPGPMAMSVGVSLLVVAAMISWLSYIYVETPFRRKTVASTRKTAYLFGISALALMTVGGLFFMRHALPLKDNQLSPAANSVVQAFNDIDRLVTCDNLVHQGNTIDDACGIGDLDRKKPPTFVVWGDSQAASIAPLFDEMGKKFNVRGSVFATGGCVSGTATCGDGMRDLALRYIDDNRIQYVFLVGRWNRHVAATPDGTRHVFITQIPELLSAPPEHLPDVFDQDLVNVVRELSSKGLEIYIVKQVPDQSGFNIREAFYLAAHSREYLARGIPVAQARERAAHADVIIDDMRTHRQVHTIDPSAILCGKTECDLEKNGELLYIDDHHLSKAGALLLEPLVATIFDRMQSTR